MNEKKPLENSYLHPYPHCDKTTEKAALKKEWDD